MSEIDDRELAALLLARALVEIRYLAASAQQTPEEDPPADALERIRFLADVVHNMPLIATPSARRPARRKAPSRRELAMQARPMSWTWNTCGPDGRAWITQHIEDVGRRWTPPPPPPTPRTGVPALTMRQRIGLLAGWPVKAPPGRPPLPRHAHVLKALDSEAVLTLHEEARHLRLGLGAGGPWLRAHLDPTGIHFLFPDPADYYWPDPDAGRRWWQCTPLLRMTDGEQVTGMLAVLPETFLALPSTVPRLRQRRLAQIARATERDTYSGAEATRRPATRSGADIRHPARAAPHSQTVRDPTAEGPADTHRIEPFRVTDHCFVWLRHRREGGQGRLLGKAHCRT